MSATGYASARFSSTVLTAAVGAVVGVGAFTFTGAIERWVAFGGGCLTISVIALAFLIPRRGAVQRMLDLPTVLIGAWLIVSSRAIESSGSGASPYAVKWLNGSAAAALLGIGLVGLLLHEAAIERDLRSLMENPWLFRAKRTRDDASGADSLTMAEHP